MRSKILSIFLVFIYVFPSVSALAGDSFQGKVYLKSNNAKIYQVLKLMDDRTQWLTVSELLREILDSDIEDKFIRNQLALAKDEVDAELYKKVARQRVLDWPFVVAKLRIIEAMMANHARLNISYDREVPLIKGLLQTYFFPGMETEGDIIYPPKKSYSFDLYGYVQQNIEKTETAPSGVIDDPRFPPKPEVKKPDPKDPKNKNGKVKKIKPIIPYNPNRDEDEDAEEVSPNGLKEDMDAITDTVEAVKKITDATYKELQDFAHAVRLQNQFEHYALLLQVIANPDSMYSDPQMFDFMKGVKLRLRISKEYDFKPEQQDLLLSVFQEQTDIGLTIEQALDSETGKAILYVSSNMVDPEVISFRYLIYLKKILDFSSNPMTQSKGRDLVAIMIKTARSLKKLQGAQRWYSSLMQALGRGSGHVLMGGYQIIQKVLEKDGQVVKLLEKMRTFSFAVPKTEKMVRPAAAAEWISKNDRYFKAVLYIAMAHDLAAGMVQYLTARDKFEKVEVFQETLSKEVVHLLYMAPLVTQKAIYRWLSWGAFAFDVGSLISDDVPPAHQVIKTVFGEMIPYTAASWITGTTYRTVMIREYESRMGLNENEDDLSVHYFSEAIHAAQDEGQLAVSRKAFEDEMRAYANKRLFMIYYLIQRWDNAEVTEMGLAERRYWDDYQAYQATVSDVISAYDKKMKELQEKSDQQFEEDYGELYEEK